LRDVKTHDVKTKDQFRTEEPRQPLFEPAPRATAGPQASGWQEAVLHLQRTAGNHATQRAVQRMISATSSSASGTGGIHRENEASSHEATAKPEAGAKQLSISKPQILTRNAPAVHPAGSQTGAPVSTESPSLGGTGETNGGNGMAVPPSGNNNGQPQLPPSLRRFFDSRQDHDLGGARVYQDKPTAPPLEKYARLTVNEPGDRFEREADAVAEHVMRMPSAAFNGGGKGLSSGDENKLQRQPSERAPEISMQRKCSQCEEEEEQKIVQPQLSEGTAQVSGVQRKCTQCEEEEEERRRKLQRQSGDAAPGVAPPIVHQVLNTPGRPLDGSTRSFMEQRFGHDFSGVRIHTDERAAESAQSVNALAYTVGRDIVFGAGQYAPTLPAGQKLLAHELTHVVQQGARPLSSSQSPISQLPSSVATLSTSILQRQPPGMSTVYTEGSVPHNHRPSGRWGDVQANPNSAFPINFACSLLSPRQVVDVAIWREFSDKPTALRHLNWYLHAGGADFNENENIDRWVRTDERFRQFFNSARQGQTRGFMEVQQGFFGSQDFKFSFGTIDRMDYEVDVIAGTIHLWFKDRYEYHPVYPFYSHFPDDEPRDTNCVHAALVELKSQGAADFWMIGEGTFPLRLFAFSPQEILGEESADSVRSAADFLDTLRQGIRADRARARMEAAGAGGIAEGSRRAHRILNQTRIREVLRRGQTIYEAQRTLLNWGHPLLRRLREVYFRFLDEVRGAFDESLALSRHDQQAERAEETAYGESLVLWMEASPMREVAMADQATFTAAFQGQESDLTAVLTNVVPSLNLAQPGMPARAREAISNAVGRNPNLITDPARIWATGPVPGMADAAIAQIDQAAQSIARGRSLLQTSVAGLDAWLQAPTQPSAAADRVNELFQTRDPGYGRLVRDRLQLMLDNLEGRGQLFAHMHRPDDTSTCATTNTLGQTPHPYEFVFCRFSADVDRNAQVLLYGLASAVIPGRGTRGAAGAESPGDRAHSGERLMLRMSTEEALNNAESYAQLIQVLAGVTVDPIPSDTVSGCTDAGPLMDALALAQSAHRRAWSYLQEAQNALNSGGTIEPWLRTLIDRFLNTPSDALLASLLVDFGNLQREGTVWHLGHTFSCAPASSCPAGAMAFDDRRIYRNGSVVPRRRPAIHNPRICAAFFTLGADDRARVAHVIVSLSFGDSFLLHPDLAWGYASLALAIYHRDFGAPPAGSLAEHTAADATSSTHTGP
jgi:hypothetical protein